MASNFEFCGWSGLFTFFFFLCRKVFVILTVGAEPQEPFGNLGRHHKDSKCSIKAATTSSNFFLHPINQTYYCSQAQAKHILSSSSCTLLPLSQQLPKHSRRRRLRSLASIITTWRAKLHAAIAVGWIATPHTALSSKCLLNLSSCVSRSWTFLSTHFF